MVRETGQGAGVVRQLELVGGRSVPRRRRAPLVVWLPHDDELVSLGLASLLAPFRDRVLLLRGRGEGRGEQADLVLVDFCAGPHPVRGTLEAAVGEYGAGRVVVYSWNTQPELIRWALRQGVAGYLSKRLGAADLVAALERIAGSPASLRDLPRQQPEAWLGQQEGLTRRECDMLTMITAGHSNREIARFADISINSVKSYIRSAYLKIGVQTRAQAVLWGVAHGFLAGPVAVLPSSGPPAAAPRRVPSAGVEAAVPATGDYLGTRPG